MSIKYQTLLTSQTVILHFRNNSSLWCIYTSLHHTKYLGFTSRFFPYWNTTSSKDQECPQVHCLRKRLKEQGQKPFLLQRRTQVHQSTSHWLHTPYTHTKCYSCFASNFNSSVHRSHAHGYFTSGCYVESTGSILGSYNLVGMLSVDVSNCRILF